jgi:hypothetical protein
MFAKEEETMKKEILETGSKFFFFFISLKNIFFWTFSVSIAEPAQKTCLQISQWH